MSDKKEVVAQSAYMIGNATKEEALRGSCSNADESSPLLGDSGASRSGRGKPSTSEHERIWATALASIVAVIPMLLAGFTIGYPSAAVLQLQDLGGARHFSDSLIAMFGVSILPPVRISRACMVVHVTVSLMPFVCIRRLRRWGQCWVAPWLA